MNPGMPMFMPMFPGIKPERRPMAPAPTTPQATLYVRNLNEKIKVKPLKSALEAIFSQFGKVLDIKVKRNIRHRGQAFVSFATIESASEAMIKSQKFPLFDKPMDIQFAREPAYAVIALEGEDKLESYKRKRVHEYHKADGERKVKRKVAADDQLPPNNVLFLQNLPQSTTEQSLVGMFSQFPGFKEVRTIAGRADIAFVDYETDLEAITAKQSLHGYRLSADHEMKVTFARK